MTLDNTQIIPQKLPQSKPIPIPKKRYNGFVEEFCEDRNFPNNNNPTPPKGKKLNGFYDKIENLEIHVNSFKKYSFESRYLSSLNHHTSNSFNY